MTTGAPNRTFSGLHPPTQRRAGGTNRRLVRWLCWALCAMVAMTSAIGASAATHASVPQADARQGVLAYIGDDSNLWIVHEDGSRGAALSSGGGVTSFAWSPRGTQIAYVAGGTLLIATLDGSTARTVGTAVESFAWSPTGSSLAYFGERDAAFNETLFVATPDGSLGRMLRTEPSPSSLMWAGEGRLVYVVSPRLGRGFGANQHLVALSIADNGRDLVTPEDGWRWTAPAITPDNKNVIIEGAVDATCGTGGCKKPQLVRLSLENIGMRTVLAQFEFAAVPRNLQISHSGRYLASLSQFHLSGCETVGTTAVTDLTTQRPVPAPAHSATAVGPSGVPLPIADTQAMAWAPNTDMLAEATRTRDYRRCPAMDASYVGAAIYIGNAGNGMTQELTAPTGVFLSEPTWSPAGTDLALVGGSPTALTRSPQVGVGIYVWTLGSTAPERIAGGRAPAWQPVSLPPVLFIPGCGGGPETWTDTGWVANLAAVSDVTSGAASGHLLGATLVGVPSVPAYVLNYRASPGSIADVAGLLPASIDRIREETGATGIVLATHSMGGVLAQYYTSGLSSVGAYRNDVVAAFMVAPPSRGSFLANLAPDLGNIFTCPQASELARNAEGIKVLETATPARLPYSVVAGTRVWVPFVGTTDGVVQADDVRPWNVSYDIRAVDGIHTDPLLLPNAIGALCSTVVSDPCTFELRMDAVVRLFRERYQKEAFR